MFVLISVPVFVAVLGIVFDVGLIFRDKNRLRHVAERAALSAASELDRGGSDRADWLRATAVNTVRQAGVQAQQDVTCPKADTDIIVTDSDTNTITECPEGSACVSVGICTTANSYFGWIPGMPELLTARAVAAVGMAESSIGACIHALSPDASKALELRGTAAIISDGCDIIVDSNHSDDALYVNSASIDVKANDADIKIVGGQDVHGKASIDPSPKTGVDVTGDPLSGIDCGDTFEGLTVYCNLPDTIDWKKDKKTGVVELSGNTVAALPSGIYWLADGLDIRGTASLLQADEGAGVIIYSPSGSVSIGGTGDITGPGGQFRGAIIADTIALVGTPGAGGYDFRSPSGPPGKPFLVQ
ncbi:pilus assembly protein TadG-related protein [Thiohalocapsa marina]|uniref:pilus assembly protein TadG-related protein n=1 Tax=Thiohalocapsa marina TaxID=424902 RepID=UPI001FE4E999|nr:pilus assembly protein TadG-related protein [Thiohalocapsa marina]